MNQPILTVENLHVEFTTDAGTVRAVDGVSFALQAGETLGIVGESGSGKSVTGLALLGLVPTPPGKIASGSIRYAGQELVGMQPKLLNRIRGDRMAMIFQDPLTALNPLLTIEEQMSEVTVLHRGLSRAIATRHAIELLERVGIPSAGRRIYDDPHLFSGGMRQRVMIAMALSCRPDVLIADEPTTALDVTTQAQILELMKQLQAEQGTAILFITHDLGIVAGLCQRVNVMYAGRFVEEATTAELFAHPRHPYTLGLLHSIPRLDHPMTDRLVPIEGQPPDPTQLPTGCRFHPRCPYMLEQCRREYPAAITSHGGSCYHCVVDVEQVPSVLARSASEGTHG
jgi:oligopeptide transport system ATP-binding protein